jgi:hypothetical protein
MFNKKAFALSTLIVASIFAQTAQAVSFKFVTTPAGKVKTFVVDKATNTKEYVINIQPRTGYAIAGAAVVVAAAIYGAAYYKNQQKPRPVVVQSEVEPVIEAL